MKGFCNENNFSSECQSLIKNRLMKVRNFCASRPQMQKDFNAFLLIFPSCHIHSVHCYYPPLYVQTISFIWHWIDGIMLCEIRMWWHSSKKNVFFVRQIEFMCTHTQRWIQLKGELKVWGAQYIMKSTSNEPSTCSKIDTPEIWVYWIFTLWRL